MFLVVEGALPVGSGGEGLFEIGFLGRIFGLRKLLLKLFDLGGPVIVQEGVRLVRRRWILLRRRRAVAENGGVEARVPWLCGAW